MIWGGVHLKKEKRNDFSYSIQMTMLTVSFYTCEKDIGFRRANFVFR